MIFIFGTDHKYQREDNQLSNENVKKFREVVKAYCSKYGIKAIVEENNEEAQEENDKNESVPRQISSELKIQHLYCDPNRNIRAKLDIPQETDIRARYTFESDSEEKIQHEIKLSYERREKYWLDKIIESRIQLASATGGLIPKNT